MNDVSYAPFIMPIFIGLRIYLALCRRDGLCSLYRVSVMCLEVESGSLRTLSSSMDLFVEHILRICNYVYIHMHISNYVYVYVSA